MPAGPNNTITQGEVSGLLALAEAASVIERGWTDVMITGGCYSRIAPSHFIRSFSSQQSARREDPESASRPFDAGRDGFVNGEGAAALMLESRETRRSPRRDRPGKGAGVRQRV